MKTTTRKKKKTENVSSVPQQIAQELTFEELGRQAPEKKASPVEFALWVRALLQNWRQGTVASKGRSDVAYSNKKPWKQKGTGRARAGSARSPLWRGGGVIFGPQERTRTLKVSKKNKQRVLMSLLTDYIAQKKVLVLDWHMDQERPKTSVAYNVLKNVGLVDKKITLFLPTTDVITYASTANIPNMRVVFFDQPNVFDLATSDTWIILKKDTPLFKEMVAKWS